MNAMVYVVDDDSSVRRSVARLLKSADYQVETFSSAQEFLQASPAAAEAACLVLDVRMPGLSGLDLQAELAKHPPSPAIIFITGHGDVPMSVRAMKEGAVDFLPKPFQDSALLQAIGVALERNRRERAEHAELCRVRARWETLTPREREVMELVVKGLLNKQIADQLGTVEKTVKVHRARVMDKMQVESVADLVRAAQRLTA